MTDVKSCPFCGSIGIVSWSAFGRLREWHVDCASESCHAEIAHFANREVAVAAWNRRASEGAIRDDERERVLNHPEIGDFARGVILEAQHQRERWNDRGKRDFDWAAVANYLLAKCLLNPAQSDGTTGEKARLHRIIALAALCANWHDSVSKRDGGHA